MFSMKEVTQGLTREFLRKQCWLQVYSGHPRGAWRLVAIFQAAYQAAAGVRAGQSRLDRQQQPLTSVQLE